VREHNKASCDGSIDEKATMCRLPQHHDNEPDDGGRLFVEEVGGVGGGKFAGRNIVHADADGGGRSDDRDGRARHSLRVAASVSAFWFFVSLIPLYNKHFFQKKYFPFPVATAGIQTGLVGTVLVAVDVARHCVFCRNHNGGELCGGEDGARACAPSWIFGPHLLWKLKACFPIGFLFGVKYGVTNLGLKMVPTPIHLLLQSTDLIWTVLWASIINREKVSRIGLTCLAGCLLGTVILSLQVMENVAETPALAILFNLISPLLLGLCISTLRSGCVELKRKDNAVGGTVTSVEITALKLVISSSVAFALANVFEGEWRAAFRDLPHATRLGVLGSATPILFYQVNCTYLTSLTSAVTVGLVGQLKIIPQWAAAVIFAGDGSFVLGSRSGAGSLVTLASTAAYALHNWMEFAERSRRRREDGRGSTVVDEGEEASDVSIESTTDEAAGLMGNAASARATRPSGYESIAVV